MELSLNTLAGGQAPRTWFASIYGPVYSRVSIPSLVGRLLGLFQQGKFGYACIVSIPSLVGRLLGLSCRDSFSPPPLWSQYPRWWAGSSDLKFCSTVALSLPWSQYPRWWAGSSDVAPATATFLESLVSIPSLVGRLLGPDPIKRSKTCKD